MGSLGEIVKKYGVFGCAMLKMGVLSAFTYVSPPKWEVRKRSKIVGSVTDEVRLQD